MKGIILITVLFFIIVLNLSLKKRKRNYSKKLKGIEGEKLAAKVLKTLPREYKVLNNILIKTGRGTSQIDHVVVSPYGIYVIETKNFGGTIYGKEDSKHWVQYINNSYYEFYNPSWQNYGHIKALRAAIDIPDNVDIFSIVAFSRRGNIEKIFSDTPVIHIEELKKYILSNKYSRVISGRDVNNICTQIEQCNLKNILWKKSHSRYVKKKQAV